MVKSGTTITAYVDGAPGCNDNQSTTCDGNGDTPLGIGFLSGGNVPTTCNLQSGTARLTGNVDEFRVLKGFARWLGPFTPPTAAYTP